MSASDDFWGGDAADGDGMQPDHAAMGAPDPASMGAPDATGGDAALTQGATTALVGFLTGGLPGLLETLDAGSAESLDEGVDDPAALHRAEEAVSHWDTPADGIGGKKPSDEPWTTVATQVSPGDTIGLEDVVRSLESDGIDCGWDPYDPRETVNFLPPNAGLTARKPFAIAVPASQLARARESLYGTPPDGVTYAWSRTAPSDFASDSPDSVDASAADDRGFDFASSGAPKPTAVRGGAPLSDNDFLARSARAGMPAGTVIGVVVVVLILIAAVAFLVVRA